MINGLRLVVVILVGMLLSFGMAQSSHDGVESSTGLSTQALGDCDNTGECLAVTVVEMITHENGATYINTSGNEGKLAPHCNALLQIFVYMHESQANYEEMYTSLLSSHLAGKPVSLKLRANPTGPTANECVIQYVTVY